MFPLARTPRPVFVLALAAMFPALAGMMPTLRAEPPSMDAATLLRLRGETLYGAVNRALILGRPPVWSPAELTRLTVHMAAEPAAGSEAGEHWPGFNRLFAAACDAAGDEQVDALATVFAAPRPTEDHYARSERLPPLALAWARRELRTITREGRSAVSRGAGGSSPLPEGLRGASPELVTAWTAFHRVAEPYAQAFGRNRERPWIAVQGQFPAFYQVVDDILLGRGTGDAPASERISRFAWGGWCGTGSEELRMPQNLVRLLALLHERRLEEAAGAALALGPMESRMGAGPPTVNLPQEVLAGLGLDWETLFAGAYLDALGVPGMTFYSGGSDKLTRLAAHGSARGAGLLVALARFAAERPAERQNFIRPLALLVTPGQTTGRTRVPAAGSGDGEATVPSRYPYQGEETARARGTEAVSETLQREALALLDALAAPDTAADTLEKVARTLGALRRPETLPTLRRLAAHPVDPVAETAAEALRAMGETAVARVKAGPLRFQVRLNGEPLARRKVGWSVRLSANTSTSSDAETDADGVLGLAPALFQDPAHAIREVAFVMEHARGDADPADPASARPWFQVFAPVPERLDQLTVVDVRVSALTLRVSRADGRSPGGPDALVRVRREREASPPPGTVPDRSHSHVFFSGEFPLPADGTITFPRFSPGTYELEVNAPGRAGWSSGPVVLDGTAPRDVWATLEPGVDVTGRFLLPGGEGKPWSLIGARLWRDGVENHLIPRDYEKNRLRGLPHGRYRLRLPANDESQRGRSHEIVPPGSRHDGGEVEFTVGPRTPAVLDLGDIPLAPASGDAGG